MRKGIIVILMMVQVVSVICGCGNMEAGLDNTGEVSKNDGSKDKSTKNEEVEHAFQITMNGDDEAIFTLKHEAVGNLVTAWNGDEGEIINKIYVELFSDKDDGEDSTFLILLEKYVVDK